MMSLDRFEHCFNHKMCLIFNMYCCVQLFDWKDSDDEEDDELENKNVNEAKDEEVNENEQEKKGDGSTNIKKAPIRVNFVNFLFQYINIILMLIYFCNEIIRIM